ncbi:unnamed protein product, partial [marine sediment metagenome]
APNDEMKKWKKQAEMYGCGYGSSGSGRKVRKVYLKAYMNFISPIQNKLIAAGKEGLTIKERLNLIGEMKITVNENWRNDPEESKKTIDSLEELEKRLLSFPTENIKVLLKWYVEAQKTPKELNNIFIVAFEEHLSTPPETHKIIDVLEKQIELLKKI